MGAPDIDPLRWTVSILGFSDRFYSLPSEEFKNGVPFVSFSEISMLWMSSFDIPLRFFPKNSILGTSY